jgi:hypothetical protein
MGGRKGSDDRGIPRLLWSKRSNFRRAIGKHLPDRSHSREPTEGRSGKRPDRASEYAAYRQLI